MPSFAAKSQLVVKGIGLVMVLGMITRTCDIFFLLENSLNKRNAGATSNIENTDENSPVVSIAGASSSTNSHNAKSPPSPEEHANGNEKQSQLSSLASLVMNPLAKHFLSSGP